MSEPGAREIAIEYDRGEISIVIEDKDTALALAQVMAEAAGPKTVNGMKTLDIGWLEMFEDMDGAIKAAWPDCTCDLLCQVHAHA